MTTFTHIEVCGHIGDVQLRKSKGPAGRPYLRLNVAVDDEEAGQKKTTWYLCIINSKAVEKPDKLLKVFTVGRKVFIRGAPRAPRAYQKGDGTWTASTTVLVDGLPRLMDPKPKDSD
jgi:hypothetical protein